MRQDYGGSVNPAKARRSWGDLLKFRSRGKERHLSPVSATLTPPAMPVQPTHNYMAEYRQKYGAYNGTVGRTSYQAMTVVKSISPPPVPPSSNAPKGYPNHGYRTNGYIRHAASSGTVSASTGATMSSTVRYTDWFGSVVGRRPPVRPPLPTFNAVPPAGLHNTEKGAAWDHYVTLDPVYEAPRVVPVQLYTNVCVCPDQMLNTKGRKKKKCKRCGRKVATMRHATAGVASKVRPAIPASMYQPPPQPPPAAAQHAWGWQVLEERVYERYEVRAPRPNHVSVRPLSDEEESPPPTPETVRSVRSMKSVKSSDSSATITRDTPEPARPAPPPPTIPRVLPATPEGPPAVTPTSSAKENASASETGDKRNSILLENPSAYQLISRYRQPVKHISSDTDELSDNAVDTSYDGWDAESSLTVTDDVQEGQVNVITIGSNQPQSVAVTHSSKVENCRDMGNRVRIHTNSSESTFSLSDQSSYHKNLVSGYNNDSVSRNNYNSSSDENSPSISSSSRSASSNTKSYSKNSISDHKSSSVNNKNGKHLYSSDKGISSSSKNNLPKHRKNLNNKNSQSSSKNTLVNENIYSSGKNNLANKKIATSASNVKKSMLNGHSSPKLNGNGNGPKLEVKKLREASELKHGGSTVRIAGQRMLVITPGMPHPESNSGFSSGEDENEVSIEDDTSDYPMSSPTTTRGSDTDTLLEEDDLPVDSSGPTYDPPTEHLELQSSNFEFSDSLLDSSNMQCERWEPVRDTIFEEEENEDEWKIENHRKHEMQEDDEESALLGDEDEKDDPSVSSSSTSSPIRHEGLHPTLSELLKVKSILKKPPSVDTSSETDSDFYLPTFSEFKQNQRKKKQVQFRPSHEVTVIEDAGESKGRKVSSARSPRREREKAKEKQKNDYNLLADLRDVYSRKGDSEMQMNHIKADFNDVKLNHEQTFNGECDGEYNKVTLSLDGDQPTHEEFREDKENGQTEEEGLFYDGDRGADIKMGEDQEQRDHTGRAGEHEDSSLHLSLSDYQTSGVSTGSSQNNQHLRLNTNITQPATGFSTFTSSTNIPTRQAPPPPRGRTLSPTRPNVPPPPPPTTRPLSLCTAPPKISQPQRPLPSPPALLLNPPTESSPPSPPPPPLPTSPPPALDDTHQMSVVNHTTQDLPSPQSPTFSSFKAHSISLNPAMKISPSLTLPATSSEISCSTECLREVLPPLGHVSVFGADEETRTATIRGRGAAHARPSIINTFTTGASASTSSASSPPVAPRRRNRNRSLSPEANESAAGNGTRVIGGRRRTSFLNSLAGEEHPYEQITDHIYEELLSNSPSHASNFAGHHSPTHNSSPHKSPSPGKSMFEGASKYEILEYLQDARRRVAITVDDEDEDVTLQGLEDVPLEAEVDLEDEEEEDQLGVDPSEDHFTVLTSRNRGNRSSNMSSNSDSSENSGLLRSDKERLTTGEVERTDSGVGSETSKPSVAVRRGQRGVGGAMVAKDGDVPLCDDCDAPVDTHRSGLRTLGMSSLFSPSSRKKGNFDRDYGDRDKIWTRLAPILVAGLLTRDQLKGIFLNVEELVEHNRMFSLQLRDALEIALDQGDEDLLTVNVAKLFLHAAPMLHAFENYCVRQGSASLLLQTLEKEKELLRIFLKVSQMENTLLRRMNLHSFLMVPVQRVTKYPLLLARLYKATPPTHPSREDCRRAKEKIELHLQHMNNETKEMSPTKLWRRISMSVGSGAPLKRSPQPHDFSTNLKLRKLALEVLEWSVEEARVVREGRLFCLAPDSNNWTRRGRTLKMASVHVLLVTQGTPTAVFEEKVPEDGLVTPHNLGIRDAAMLAFKDHKVSKAALIRHDPWLLSRCVVAWESEGETECFEVTDLNSKDTFIFKGSDNTSTEAWFRYIQFHALSVGMWKRRRPALANIMINGMSRS
ncbi:Intersectin-1-like 2 [Homarus americanus]|uniref:Intersectin-1-like 2 n=1 Tax=Homarus americanus TaxID=6706 RepID=A0A8J5N0Z0_HOMAM|nr:Intersectin-1-like 2 [Homarus americanus]